MSRAWLGIALSVGLSSAACSDGSSPSARPAPAVDAGSTAPPGASISGVVPARVFLSRTSVVTLSGYATSWSDATRVDFGPGITVTSLAVASPTALQAIIVTARDTPTGLRDVVVHDRGNEQRYAGAFQVQPPVVASFEGTMAQGALAQVRLQVVDTSIPLDTTSVTSLSGVVSYPNIALSLPSGIANQATTSVSDFNASFVLSVDVDARPGTWDLAMTSGPAGATTEFPAPGMIPLGARDPAPIVPGQPAAGVTSEAFDSRLYEVALQAPTIVDLAVSSTMGILNPSVALLPSSGHFADLLGFGSLQTAVSSGPLYPVYWENSGGIGPYDLNVVTTPVAQSVAATLADATPSGAIVVTALPFLLTDGDLSRGLGFDWVAVDAPGPVTLRLQTTGDLQTDVRVTVYQDDGVTVVGHSIDDGAAADGTAPLPAAGRYLILFSQGSYFTPAHARFTAVVRVD